MTDKKVTEIQATLAEADSLFSEAEVEAALDRMAEAISKELAERNPLILCVMNGGLVPTAGLLKRLDFPLELDYLHATRYQNGVNGGDIFWLKTPAEDLTGRNVLVVDDILDEGITLTAIMNACRGQQPESVYSAVLVNKRHQRKPGIQEADFTGLEVPDRYIFGYGMDYQGYLRNARGIYAVKGM